MMNFSFEAAVSDGFSNPAESFLYRDMETPVLVKAKEAKTVDRAGGEESARETAAGPSAEEINELLRLARIEAVTETEKRLSGEYREKADKEAEKIRHALELFDAERKGYFSRVECDVVHLALAIAAKVLHREAQVDPLLVAA
jgi:flagellar assembly protein FliH